MTHHAAGVRGFDWAARRGVLAGGYDPFHGGRPGGSFSLCDDDLLCRAPGFAKLCGAHLRRMSPACRLFPVRSASGPVWDESCWQAFPGSGAASLTLRNLGGFP